MSEGSEQLPQLGSLAQSARNKHIRQARKTLIAVGIIMALVQTGMYFYERTTIRDEISKLVQRQAPGARLSPQQMDEIEASANRMLLLFHGGTIAVAIAFIVMGFVVEKYPVPITALALIMFIGLNVIFAVVDIHNLYRGWILKLIFIVALSKGLSAAIAAQNESRIEAEAVP